MCVCVCVSAVNLLPTITNTTTLKREQSKVGWFVAFAPAGIIQMYATHARTHSHTYNYNAHTRMHAHIKTFCVVCFGFR